jgi:cytidylate kinase
LEKAEEGARLLITISREYLAGGSRVAAEVASSLGWTVIDDAFVNAVAERSGFTPEDVRSLEESVPTFLERFAQSSAFSSPESLMAAPSAIEGPATVELAHVTRKVIEELSQRDRIVFVGRAAAEILAGERDAIHVRLVAPVSVRVHAAMNELALGEAEARAEVRERDDIRARYHKELFGRDWNDSANYHMVLNTDALGLSGAAELIVARARALGWPESSVSS